MYRYAIETIEQTVDRDRLQVVLVEYTSFKKAIKQKKAKGVYRI